MKKKDTLFAIIIFSLFMGWIYSLVRFVMTMSSHYTAALIIIFIIIVFMYCLWRRVENKFYRKKL